jgi:D-amino-acid dehydrogenase
VNTTAPLHLVVIGAGVVGIITAIEARQRGLAVTLIDPEEPGGEHAASYGNAGWLSSHSVIPPSTPGLWKQLPRMLRDPAGPLKLDWTYVPKAASWLARYVMAGSTPAKVSRTAAALRPLLVGASGLHKRLADAAGVPELIEQRGVMHAYPSEQAFQADGLGWRIRRECGIAWTEFKGPALRDIEPALASRYQFGLVVDEVGRCRDPGAYLAALASYFRSLGGVIERAAAADFVLSPDNRLASVLTDRGEMPCDRAVIAAGIRSKPIAARLGDRLPLESERGYHVMIETPQHPPAHSIMTGDSKIVINPMLCGLRASGQVEIAGVDAAPDWRRADIVLNHLKAAVPGLGDPSRLTVRRWMGHRPSLPDGLPCIGPSRPSGDVIYAFGHGHVGLTASARTGRIAAQLAAGEFPEIAIEPFSPLRFLGR